MTPPNPLTALAERQLPYIYFWHRMDRKGQPCEVLARGKMNSCLVRFADGFTAITSRNAIRRARAASESPHD